MDLNPADIGHEHKYTLNSNMNRKEHESEPNINSYPRPSVNLPDNDINHDLSVVSFFSVKDNNIFIFLTSAPL